MISLSHIGEELISEMINRSAKVREHIGLSGEVNAVPEVKLHDCGGYRFDGAHKVDVALLDYEQKRCMPLESKLGLDRLGATAFDRFLSGCGLSHGNTRIKGNMISILERKLPDECGDDEISLNHDGSRYLVSHQWNLIVRRRVAESWARNGRPALSYSCSVYVFEDLVDLYGGGEAFNEMVGAMVSFDYFEQWLRPD